MRRLVLLAFLGLALVRPAAADLAAGAEAYDGGDYETALAEWRAAAEAGDVEAAVALAGLYQHGEGARRDTAEAARWYRRAAQRGHVLAQLNLGELYSEGAGVPRDPVEAYLWLALAARGGNAWAQARHAALVESMTPAEVAEGESRARAWTPSD